jgi:hypothetical protein
MGLYWNAFRKASGRRHDGLARLKKKSRTIRAALVIIYQMAGTPVSTAAAHEAEQCHTAEQRGGRLWNGGAGDQEVVDGEIVV